MRVTGLIAVSVVIGCQLAQAAKTTEAIATVVDGMKIPIQIVTPDEGDGPFPVVYHVHGGGWNGGTKTEVPGANVSQLPNYLCDELGIVFVGLAYRCKNQGGTFALAMEDLKASISWFESRAGEFRADTSRSGFSGGSAGTPLSALLAQQMASTKAYIGFFGVYDLLNNEESLFPDETARGLYGLASEAQQRTSSAYHHLRAEPPATLLFHGGKDILTHETQSIRFAEKIREAGGEAEVILFPELNHGYFNPRNPDAFKKTVLAVAALCNRQFNLGKSDFDSLENKLTMTVARFYSAELMERDQLVGIWQGKRETIVLSADGTGELRLKNGKSHPITFVMGTASFEIVGGKSSETYFMQRDGRAIYKIYPDGRFAGRKEHFSKRKESFPSG